MGWNDSWRDVTTLFRYWIKGRLSRATLVWILLGEGFSVILVAFIGSSFISFSNSFSLGGGFSSLALGLVFAFILIGLLQSGFAGSGLPVVSADVDYVFTSPVKPRDIFAAKVLLNSLTTVLFSFPPMLVLYLMLSRASGAPPSAAALAGLTTLAFLVMGLVLSADITVSLGSSIGPRLKPLRNALVVLVGILSILPVTLLIPGAPVGIISLTQVLPSGLTAAVCLALVGREPWNLGLGVDVVLLVAWFAGLLLLGVRMSRGHFYEVVQVMDAAETPTGGGSAKTVLTTSGRSVWSVVRMKEGLLMKRSKERRGLLVSALFLSGFMIIYSLAGTFQSSPTSFLFILFIIGSFGSGTANGWMEKERLWIVKTSVLDLRRYTSAIFRARIGPLILILAPVTVAVGVPLVLERMSQGSSVLGVALALPAALEIAAIMMGGGMYFAARYGQSSTDEILTSQAQQMTDVKRFLYQTVVNLLLVSPLMGLVLAAEYLSYPLSLIPPVLLGVLLLGATLAYSYWILTRLLDTAGDSIERREDL